jgi:hypothetical protein
MPSVLAAYPGRPRLPIAQKPGQNPEISPSPGRDMLASRRPPLKQSLFQLWTIPDRYFSSWFGKESKRISRTPSLVVTASGSYHCRVAGLIKLLVWIAIELH